MARKSKTLGRPVKRRGEYDEHFIPEVGDTVVCTDPGYNVYGKHLQVDRVIPADGPESYPTVYLSSDRKNKHREMWVLRTSEFEMVSLCQPPITAEEKKKAAKFPPHSALAKFLGL